jgi:hypothetical protein
LTQQKRDRIAIDITLTFYSASIADIRDMNREREERRREKE